MTRPVLLDRDGPIATLTLNRPEALNALDFAMIDDLVDHTGTLATDATVRAVVLQGAGRHFMAGGDIRTFGAELAHVSGERQRRFQRMVERMHVAIENLHRMPAPLLCKVHGAVAGFGLSLMNCCDLVVAADDAYFTAAYRHLGLSPDGGGTWSLPRLVGLRKAMEIALLGERFDAAEALRLGLVNRVVPADQLDATANRVARVLANGPVLAMRETRRLLRTAASHSLSEQLQAEATSFARCTADDDFVEGVTAFLAKRAPDFRQG